LAHLFGFALIQTVAEDQEEASPAQLASFPFQKGPEAQAEPGPSCEVFGQAAELWEGLLGREWKKGGDPGKAGAKGKSLQRKPSSPQGLEEEEKDPGVWCHGAGDIQEGVVAVELPLRLQEAGVQDLPSRPEGPAQGGG
jgi:hypothetical protein